MDHDTERRPLRPLRKVGIAVAGGMTVAAGVAMLVLPGPGLLTIAAGLGILGTEYHRPRRMLDSMKARYRSLTGRGDEPGAEATESTDSGGP